MFPAGNISTFAKNRGREGGVFGFRPDVDCRLQKKVLSREPLVSPRHAEIRYRCPRKASLCTGVGKRVAGEFNEGSAVRSLGGVQASMICGEAVHGASWARPCSPRGTLDKRAFSLISSHPGVRERSMDGRECLVSVSMRVRGRRLRP